MTRRRRRRARIILSSLYPRHPGLAEGGAAHIAEAASVCLARFHGSSPVALGVTWAGRPSIYDLVWRAPGAREVASNRNAEEATRDGAYAVALGAVDARLRLVTIGRAESRTGADWYLVPVASLEQAFDLDSIPASRLEVSGVSDDDEGRMNERVRVKLAQAVAGRSEVPALVGVVGFRSGRCILRRPQHDGH